MTNQGTSSADDQKSLASIGSPRLTVVVVAMRSHRVVAGPFARIRRGTRNAVLNQRVESAPASAIGPPDVAREQWVMVGDWEW